MVSTGLASLDQLLGGTGYPDRSIILVVGSPGSAKDVVGFHLFHDGVSQGDFCIYATKQPVREIARQMTASGFPDPSKEKALWIAADGGQMKYIRNDMTNLSLCIKEALSKNHGRKIRIVVDAISSLLMLNSPDQIYRFLDQLFSEVKQHDAVLLATLEKGMHETQVLVAMEQLSDGVLEITTAKSGARQQILQIRKMQGVALPDNPSFILSPQMTQTEAPPAIKNAQTLNPLRIAILPFANISPDPSDEYFADGMTEELIATISKVSALKVIARTSVMRYKNNPEKTIDEIGQELRAGTVLEGSIRKSGSKLRITVQLINSETSEHFWSESYDRELKDVFAIQGEVSQTVADTLRAKLLPEEKKKISKEPTSSQDAFVMYLRGQYIFQTAWNEAGIKEAMSYYERAVELDPSYAGAISRIAECLAVLGNAGWLPPLESFPRAEELVKRALDIDPKLPDVYNCLSYIKFNNYDWQGAIAEVRKALELSPNFSAAHAQYAGYLWVIGKFEESIEEAKKALELDPFSGEAHFVMLQALYFSKKYHDCKEWAQRLLAIEPSSESMARSFLGQISLQEFRYDEAIAEFQKIVAVNGNADYNLLFIAQAYFRSGRKEEAEEVLNDYKEAAAKKEYVPAAYTALMYLVSGENEKALDWLEKAADERSLFGIQALKVSPVYDSLRGYPRFIGLLERIGLA